MMKIYDISQEVFGCKVYPGDPSPHKQQITSMENGDIYNLTAFSMCAHNGTHVDAPCHFICHGKGIDEINLDKTVGYCYVAEFNGEVTEAIACEILNRASFANSDSSKRILLKGEAIITAESAKYFAEQGVLLVGVESQTVGPADAPMQVHKILLNNDVVLLEGIRLQNVKEGVYLLNAAPLNLRGADGSPCRAILIEL